MDEVAVFDRLDGVTYSVELTTRVNGDQVYVCLGVGTWCSE